jgi:hypothetical protein
LHGIVPEELEVGENSRSGKACGKDQAESGRTATR